MPDNDPSTTPSVDWRARLIDRLAGLSVAVLAVVMYALGVADELWILVLLGGLALVGVSGIPVRGQRGFARVAALVPMVAAGVVTLVLLAIAAMLAPGCASTQVDGRTMGFRLRDDPKRPAPACLYRHTVDDVLLDEGSLDNCPDVPVCREPSP